MIHGRRAVTLAAALGAAAVAIIAPLRIRSSGPEDAPGAAVSTTTSMLPTTTGKPVDQALAVAAVEAGITGLLAQTGLSSSYTTKSLQGQEYGSLTIDLVAQAYSSSRLLFPGKLLETVVGGRRYVKQVADSRIDTAAVPWTDEPLTDDPHALVDRALAAFGQAGPSLQGLMALLRIPGTVTEPRAGLYRFELPAAEVASALGLDVSTEGTTQFDITVLDGLIASIVASQLQFVDSEPRQLTTVLAFTPRTNVVVDAPT